MMNKKSYPGAQSTTLQEHSQTFIQAITDRLEYERRARQQMYRYGAPAVMLLIVTGLFQVKYYEVFWFIAAIAVLRFVFLKPQKIDWKIDEQTRIFGRAARAFRTQRSVENGASGDRVRILLRQGFRRLRWPFPIIILDQRRKEFNGQIFLIIGPSDHWWSGGGIWSQWPWTHRTNTDLDITKKTIAARKQFLLEIHLEKGLVWSLNFKNANNRDQAYEALNTIREIGQQRSKGADTRRPQYNRHQTNRSKNNSIEERVPEKAWYEILGVSQDASASEIQAAYKEAIKKCHPDTVANRSEIIKRAAAAETVQLNAAYENAKAERRL